MFSLRPNGKQVVHSACHYVHIEQSMTERQHLEQEAEIRCGESLPWSQGLLALLIQLCRLLSFTSSHQSMFVLLYWGENEHHCCHLCPLPFGRCCFLSSPCCCRPQAAPSPFSCQLLETTLAAQSYASPIMATNVCTSLKDCNNGACWFPTSYC